MEKLISENLYIFLKEKIAKFFPEDKLQVYLFGSRARGDHRERSDYDIGIVFPAQRELEKQYFISEFQEEVPTLCGVDIVDLTEATEDLKNKIINEGILIYGSEKKDNLKKALESLDLALQ